MATARSSQLGNYRINGVSHSPAELYNMTAQED